MSWRTKLPFWAAALVPRLCLLTMTQKLSLCEIHFLFIITRRSLNHQQTNKQRITLLYNEMKRVSFSAAAMVSALYFQRKHYISEIITFRLFLQVDLQIISGPTRNLLTFSTMSWRTNLPFWVAALVPRCVF